MRDIMEVFQNGNGDFKLQRYSTTTEPRTPTSSPITPNGPGGGVLGGGVAGGGLSVLSSQNPSFHGDDDDVFYDEKLKQNNNELPHIAPPPQTPGTAPSPSDPAWPHRALRVRHCLLIGVLILLVIGLAVGVGVAIILTQQVTPEPATTTPTPTSTTTITPDIVTYSGTLQLDSPWEVSEKQLQKNLSTDFVSIVNDSSLEEHYRKLRVVDYSPFQRNINFVLEFSSDVLTIENSDGDPVRDVIQKKLRELVAETDTRVVDFDPNSLFLIDYIPEKTTSSSSSTSSTEPTTSSSTESTSQSSSTQSTTLSSSTESTTESTSTESTSVSSSSSSSTEPTTLSSTTESTTVSSTTESTTVSSTTESTTTVSSTESTTVSSSTQSSTISSTTESTTDSTSTLSTTPASTTTTEPMPAECRRLEFAPCLGLGYTHFSFPNLFGSETLEFAVEDFYYLGNDSFNSGCTTDPTFFCGFAFPPCSQLSLQTLPCLETCQAAVDSCLSHLPEPLDCEGYPTEQPCLMSPFLPEIPSTTPIPTLCSPQSYERCAKHGFTSTLFPTWFAVDAASNLEQFEKWAMPGIRSGCHQDAEFFMCAAFYPLCNEQHQNVTPPCRSLCHDVEDSCYDNGAVLNLDCSIFPSDHSKCVLPPTSTSTPAPSTTTTDSHLHVSTTPIPPRCEAITIETCRQFGYVNGTVPNKWGSNDPETTLGHYYGHVLPVVSTGCDSSALFYFCAVLFPRCDGGVNLDPCRSVCQDYNTKCSNETGFFQQDCSLFPTSAEQSSCLLPPAKLECGADEFSCDGIPRCVPKSTICDRKDDCGDWSDERDCECNEEFEFQCDMGLCIRNYRRCDNQTDCPDGSDELQCSHCSHNQFECDDGTCLMAEWVCDGQPDCPPLDYNDYVEEDEQNCSACKVYDEFSCVSRECLPISQRCDGTPQCSDHTDERSCVHLGPPVFVNVAGEVMPICAQGFNTTMADITCNKLGFPGSSKWSEMDNEGYTLSTFALSPNGTSFSAIGPGTIVTDCRKEVELECRASECGKRVTDGFSITFGQNAEVGEVPWQASLQEYGKHFCGGSIVHPYFVLTAAHCVEKHTMSFEFVEVVLGARDFKVPEKGRQMFRVKRIIVHPDYLAFQGNDVALIELDKPAVFNDLVRPLCFRRPGDVFSKANLCYTSGWGKTDPTLPTDVMATHLQVVKMSLWDTDKCNSSYVWDGLLQKSDVCAGYYAGIKAACRGDSGGPLFCLDNEHTYRLVGVASYVHLGCNKPEKPVVFSDAGLYTDWINNNTVCKFQCNNGRCLFDRAMVCNKVKDCGDEDDSDETRECDISSNCSFDHPYLCGYRSKWLWKSESLSANRYPLYDHSVGRYPGMYLLAAFKGQSINTPRIDLTSPHCFRFRYHMRGPVRLGLTAHAHELSEPNQWRKLWQVKNLKDGRDRWFLGQFDLEPGHYDIVLQAYEDGVASVDDTVLLPGACRDQGCEEGEFSCMTSNTFNCLPDEVRCNTIRDCDNGEDEAGCTAPSYHCDFENGLLCGLEQDNLDSTAGEWGLVNASRAGFHDYTFKNGTGNMLRMVTERLLSTDYVYMGHDVNLNHKIHCLAFSYYSTSTVHFSTSVIPQVNGQYEEDGVLLWSMVNRQTSGWTRTQAEIPALEMGYLYYAVIGGDLDRSVIHPMLALDDITISPGNCPALTCPAGQTLCTTEPYCLDDSRFCDRRVDCLDAADEVNCTCTAEEYKCPKGPCIALNKTCDTVPDCQDASDEGALCDALRSVDCDFEHRFMCGYTHNASSDSDAPYTFIRQRNRTPGLQINAGTGPIYDHTLQNASGYWAFANGENGHPYDYVALESPPFATSGSDVLVFYYFAYSTFYHFWVTGSLSLEVKDGDTGTRQVPWFMTVDGNSTWRSYCMQLPKSERLTVSFVAMRGENRRADLAVDDVSLLKGTTCDQFYKDSRIQGGAVTDPPLTTDTPPSGCPPGQKACRSGMCIKESQFCDTIPDCVDMSDENDCNNNNNP